jgi:hypothetical protein
MLAETFFVAKYNENRFLAAGSANSFGKMDL